ncbi:hypothetical protein J3E72DRAFT_266926 [Bipolaris maydis]|nr:hypothetical protein J3E72DRAFT_266926 [Bipolaris maydis]
MLLGPTLFPLAFAALGGRSLKNIALWKAQQGSSIGSSLRLLHEANSTIVTSRPVYYPDPEAYSSLVSVGSAHYFNQMSAIISTSILTADTLQNSPVDIWNHAKITRLRQLEQADLGHDLQDRWVHIREDTTAYTSLTGLSVVGLQADSVANFSVVYEYMYADCKAQIRGSGDEVKAYLDRQIPRSGLNGSLILPSGWPYKLSELSIQLNRDTDTIDRLFNVSYLNPIFGQLYYQSSFFLVSPQNLSTTWATTGYLFYGTRDGYNERTMFLYKCALHDMEIEANTICSSAACRTSRLRRPLNPKLKQVYPPTDTQGYNVNGEGRPGL